MWESQLCACAGMSGCGAICGNKRCSDAWDARNVEMIPNEEWGVQEKACGPR